MKVIFEGTEVEIIDLLAKVKNEFEQKKENSNIVQMEVDLAKLGMQQKLQQKPQQQQKQHKQHGMNRKQKTVETTVLPKMLLPKMLPKMVVIKTKVGTPEWRKKVGDGMKRWWKAQAVIEPKIESVSAEPIEAKHEKPMLRTHATVPISFDQQRKAMANKAQIVPATHTITPFPKIATCSEGFRQILPGMVQRLTETHGEMHYRPDGEILGLNTVSEWAAFVLEMLRGSVDIADALGVKNRFTAVGMGKDLVFKYT